MKTAYLLSGQYPELAAEEVLSQTGKENHMLLKDILITQSNGPSLENRLGLSHAIYDLLFICAEEDIRDAIAAFDWQGVYKGSFCVRVHGKKIAEKDAAKMIHERLKSPTVDLKSPETKIEIFFREGKAVCCRLRANADKSYLGRRAHLRPSLHPTSIHPGLARACINLTGLTEGRLLDPFCGSGGILIEAGLMGFEIEGFDIDEKQLERARKNLTHYKIERFGLSLRDATKARGRYDAIVTDLPYGKGSKAREISSLYYDFLNNAINITERMIVIFPDFIDFRKIIGEWLVENVFKVYVHRSLSRNIVKLNLSRHPPGCH